MGLRNTLQKAAQAARKATGDIPETVDYLAFSSGSYNASAGTTTSVFATTAGVRCVFDVFEFREIDGVAIHPEDRKAYIPSLDAAGITPGVNDRIVTSTGETWRVHNRQSDPVEALWILHLRRST